MITGELKSQIDAVWNDFWSGGISNPLEVMEQLTYLLFIKGLDERQKLAENKSRATGEPIESPIFPGGGFSPDELTPGRPYADLRWGHFKNLGDPKEMYEVVDKYVFPFLHQRAENSSHAKHMAGARLTIPTPALLKKAVDGLDAIPMGDQDTKGDVYEYMLSKIATSGQNGQFRTPRHIIELMVEMTDPQPGDTICDPASGTCGFLVAAAEHVRTEYPGTLTDPKQSKHFNEQMFNGYDFDNTMLRIGSMNMQLHGVQSPTITYQDSLAEEHSADIEAYNLILANPPFAGSLDYESTAKDLLQVVKTKKTELLFLALFLRLLKPGGRAAVIVPDGVLFGSTKAHKELRRMLVEDQKLDGIVSLPSGVFKPYAGVSTAVLFFTKGASTDVEKARKLYDWIVANTFREPKVKGCGEGDIKTMLETGNLGGKCADLNALFVGMNRALGIPARDVYGLRVAPSAFGYKELGGNSASLKGAQHCRADQHRVGLRQPHGRPARADLEPGQPSSRKPPRRGRCESVPGTRGVAGLRLPRHARRPEAVGTRLRQRIRPAVQPAAQPRGIRAPAARLPDADRHARRTLRAGLHGGEGKRAGYVPAGHQQLGARAPLAERVRK